MGVNGLVLLAEAAVRGIPTVMLTAHSLNPASLKASIQTGALSYLPKEELPKLDEFISEVLETHKSGGSTWKLLSKRLGNFFDRAFGQGWMTDDQKFWSNYYMSGRQD
jgi:DNA-binding NarL/FixJ family response regulator